MLLCTITSFAQDVIVKKNGSTVLCRVVDVSSSEVVYKKWTDLQGSNYVLNRTDITTINYENGRKEILSSQNVNEFAPSNQNTGQQSLNDNALLKLADVNNCTPKVRKMKLAGWIGGIIIAGAGSIISCTIIRDDDGTNAKLYGPIASIAAGAIWTTGFLIAANQQQKKAESLVINSPILQDGFTFKDGSVLMGSIDLLKDNIKHQHSLGIGLCYNF